MAKKDEALGEGMEEYVTLHVPWRAALALCASMCATEKSTWGVLNGRWAPKDVCDRVAQLRPLIDKRARIRPRAAQQLAAADPAGVRKLEVALLASMCENGATVARAAGQLR